MVNKDMYDPSMSFTLFSTMSGPSNVSGSPSLPWTNHWSKKCFKNMLLQYCVQYYACKKQRSIISLLQPCHGILRVRQHTSRTYFPCCYHFGFVKRLCKFNIHPFCQQIFIPACNPELSFCPDASPQSQSLHSPPPLVLGLAWIGLYWVEYF